VGQGHNGSLAGNGNETLMEMRRNYASLPPLFVDKDTPVPVATGFLLMVDGWVIGVDDNSSQDGIQVDPLTPVAIEQGWSLVTLR
jgi:hypothetical protein